MEKIVKGEVGNKETYGEHDDAAVLFCKYHIQIWLSWFLFFKDKKGDNFSNKVLKALENIDDDCDEQGIIFVKVNILYFFI